MLRATFRSLLARKLRLVLSALAIVLGVSFVSGAFVLTDSLGKVFDQLFSDVNRNVAVDVQPTEVDGDLQQGRVLPASLVATLQRIDGVDQVAGQVNGAAQLVGKNHKLVGSGAAPTFGFNWVGSKLQTGQIVVGRPPVGSGEIAVNRALADKAGYAVGDRAPVLTDAPLATYTIVGIVEFDGKSSLGGSSNVFFDTPTAQAVLGVPDGFNEITVSAKDGVAQDALRDRVAKVLPAGTTAKTGEQLAKDQAGDVKKGLGFFNTFLLVFALVALFVGAFIIFNTFSMLVAQRTRELALMRALGASRGQVNRAVLLEAVVVGLLSSVLGLAAGVGVALGLTSLFGAFGAELPEGPTVVQPRTVVAAFLVGTVVTALAALLPARRAGRVAPIAALRDAATPDRSLRGQTMVGSGLLLVGVLVLARALTAGGLLLLGVGVLLTFLAVAMLSPVVSRPVSTTVGRLFSRRLPGRLGRDNAVRNPRRTAATAAALMVGVALISAVTVLGSSVKASVAVIAEQAVGADLLLDVQGPGFPDEVIAQARTLPGVAQVVGLKFGPAKIGDETPFITAVPPAAIGPLVRLHAVSGTTRLSDDALLLSETEADKADVGPGDVLPVQLSRGGVHQLKVAGVYADNQLVGGYLVSDALASGFSSQRNGVGLVGLAPGADVGAVRSALDAQVASYPNIVVDDRGDFVDDASGQVDQVVTIINILLGFSVMIALLGVLNTLALSVLERTRELGLLRAVGMSRRQVKRMVRVESVLICAFGGLLGLVVGTAFGIALQHALDGQGVTELSVPGVTLVVYLLLAALAGVLAAWLPARRASRLNVLAAIATT